MTQHQAGETARKQKARRWACLLQYKRAEGLFSDELDFDGKQVARFASPGIDRIGGFAR